MQLHGVGAFVGPDVGKGVGGAVGVVGARVGAGVFGNIRPDLEKVVQPALWNDAGQFFKFTCVVWLLSLSHIIVG